MESKRSPVEVLKENSNYLRGNIKQEVSEDTSHFSKDSSTLLKQHGTYEQDDRDKRQALLAAKQEPAYSMMVRSKIVGGRMTPAQYLVHDDLSSRYANGTLRITTRQGFQFHGVLKKNVKAVIRAINESLLTTLGACGDNVRNVLACPAPFQDRKSAKIYEYAKAVSDEFLSRSGAYHEIWLDGKKIKSIPDPSGPGEEPEPVYGKTYLPRKFKIAFAFPNDNCIDVYSNDLGIVPEVKNGKLTGFDILVGGGFGMTHGVQTTYPRLASPLCFVKPEDLVQICKAVILVQRDNGNRADRKRARLKYLIDDKGLDWFRAEVEKRFGRKTEDAHGVPCGHLENHLGWHEEGAGKWFIGIPVENGRVKDEGKGRMKAGFRALVEKFQPEIHLTAQQDILFSGFTAAQKREVETLLESYGIALPSEISHVRRDAIACPALPTCGLAIAESERVMPSLVDEIEAKIFALGLEAGRIMIRMTGCPNGCARPYNSEIAFVGRSIGTYTIFVGGNLEGTRLNQIYADKIAQKDVASAIFPLLELYKRERQPAEGFGDFCHRLGIAKLKEKAASLTSA